MIEDQAVNGSGANSLKSLNSAKPQVDESSNKNAAITEDIISPQQSTIPQYDAVSVEPREMNPYGEWYVALYDFVPSEPNDLPLKAGDRILVTESVNDWWKGTCDGKSGIFPANYVQKDPSVLSSSANEVPDLGSGRALAAFEATADNQLSLRVGDIVKVRIKSSAGWWQGEMANGKGEKKIGWFPGNYIEMIEDGKPLLAEAMFDYTAQRDDELTFKRGAVIIVNDRSNREWWKGRLESTATGSEALFPANYVRLR
ncbi:hypothetical protein AB6A40_007545 [Gnathostoma spinigerum]|uniref:SH3 domain-containing protein n=1 Tax=Gnathostoma spinigerum TaxID=75299 RepID=A0ABD6ENH3_9BILA